MPVVHLIAPAILNGRGDLYNLLFICIGKENVEKRQGNRMWLLSFARLLSNAEVFLLFESDDYE